MIEAVIQVLIRLTRRRHRSGFGTAVRRCADRLIRVLNRMLSRRNRLLEACMISIRIDILLRLLLLCRLLYRLLRLIRRGGGRVIAFCRMLRVLVQRLCFFIIFGKL